MGAGKIGTRALLTRLRRLDGDLQDHAGNATVDAPSRVNARVPKRVRELIYDFRRAAEDIFEVVFLIVDGHVSRKSAGGKRKTRQERVMENPHRVMSAVFRLFTTSIVSDMELFIRRYSELRVSSAAVVRFRQTALGRHRDVRMPSDPAKAQRWLVDWLKPSASSRIPWCRRLRVVLGIRVEPPLAEVLHTLILARNFLIHPRRRPPKMNWTNPDLPEVMITCLLGVMSLTVRVADAES